MYAIKNVILLKEHVINVDVSIYYMDIRAYGKGFEEFYQRAREEFGIRFVRGRVSRIMEVPETSNLTVRAEDTDTGKILDREFDMVVLSIGLSPAEGNRELGEMLSIPLDENGFVEEMNVKTNPIDTPTDGIFVAGVAEGPKDIPDSVADASAAAIRAVTYVQGGEAK